MPRGGAGSHPGYVLAVQQAHQIDQTGLFGPPASVSGTSIRPSPQSVHHPEPDLPSDSELLHPGLGAGVKTIYYRCSFPRSK